MIPWRQIQRQNFTSWVKLAEFLQLSEAQQSHVLQQPHFPLNIPLRLAEKIEKAVLDDPILLQFLPTHHETVAVEGYRADPVGDVPAQKTTKLLQKYAGRALLLTTGNCVMNCRFCFRQHYDYDHDEKTFDAEFDIVAQDPSLTEMILSGGDPLSLSDERLRAMIERLDTIPHLKRLRFHTRFPIGIPERIDTSFLTLLASTRLQIVFVIHTNHARELDHDVLNSLKKIQRLNIPILSQTVLLRGVNDRVEVLRELFEKLSDNGIIPYYLHQLDPTRGTAHFEVEEEKGVALIEEISKQLPGYAVPRYVKEESSLPSKTHILSTVLSPNMCSP